MRAAMFGLLCVLAHGKRPLEHRRYDEQRGLKSRSAALIIEPRLDHRNLPAALSNVRGVLPASWRVYLATLRNQTLPMIGGRRLNGIHVRNLRDLGWSGTRFNRGSYNELLKTHAFWKSFEEQQLLLFEVDARLCSSVGSSVVASRLRALSRFAYVGAPWGMHWLPACASYPPAFWRAARPRDAKCNPCEPRGVRINGSGGGQCSSPHPKGCMSTLSGPIACRPPAWCLDVPSCVGNSGLSLWRIDVMEQLLRRPHVEAEVHTYDPLPTGLVRPEPAMMRSEKLIDTWACRLLQRAELAGLLPQGVAAVPAELLANTFSVATTFAGNFTPLGFHRPSKLLVAPPLSGHTPASTANELVQRCPEAAEFLT